MSTEYKSHRRRISVEELQKQGRNIFDFFREQIFDVDDYKKDKEYYPGEKQIRSIADILDRQLREGGFPRGTEVEVVITATYYTFFVYLKKTEDLGTVGGYHWTTDNSCGIFLVMLCSNSNYTKWNYLNKDGNRCSLRDCENSYLRQIMDFI